MINFIGKYNSDMLRTVIIDDETHIRETLTSLLADYCPQVKVVGEGDSVASGIKIIHSKTSWRASLTRARMSRVL